MRPLALAGASYKNYNVRSWGAVGNGIADDTVAIQATINACPIGGVVYIPNGLYKITAALSCVNNISIVGESVVEVWGNHISTFESVPGSAPWITGSVLLQSTAGENGINVTGTGINASLQDFGIRFADSIAFNNTGHGVFAVPTAMTGGGHESGIVEPHWDNIIVFGHDGNHYAFYSINMILCQVTHIRGYGGGGWYQECDSFVGNYGNGLVEDTYFGLLAKGTADGYHLKSRTTSFPGWLNMMVFIRVQCNVMDATFTPLGIALSPVAPTAAQYRWKDEGDPGTISVIGPDLECPDAIPSPVSFGLYTVVHPAGSFFSAPGGVRAIFRTHKPNDGQPTFVFGLGAGTIGVPVGAFVGVSLDRNDERGEFVFTTSGAPQPADWNMVVRITLQAWNGIAGVFLQPVSPAYGAWDSMDAKFYPAFVTPNSFEVWTHTGLLANTQYAFEYLVVE